MRVIVITGEPFPLGGAGSNRILSYCTGIAALGHFVKVICVRPTEPNKENAVNAAVEGECQRVKFRYTPGTTTWPESKIKKVCLLARGIVGAIRDLWKSKAEDRDTILLLYSNDALHMGLFFLVTRILRIPYVQEKNEYPFVLNKKTCLGRLYAKIYVNCFYRFFDGMIIMTNTLMEYFEPLVRRNAKRLHVPMTVEPERFISGEKRPAFFDYVAYCGHFPGNRDGIPILLEAFKMIASKYPALKLCLIGLSDGNSEWTDMVTRINELGIDDRVLLVGRISREEMPGYLKGARVLALARPYSLQSANNFPTKLGEFLCTGNPVVATRVGEVPLYLEHRVNAFLCEPDDPKAFADQMDVALADPEFAARVGHEGRNLALRVFDYRVQSGKMVEFFESLLSGRKLRNVDKTASFGTLDEKAQHQSGRAIE